MRKPTVPCKLHGISSSTLALVICIRRMPLHPVNRRSAIQPKQYLPYFSTSSTERQRRSSGCLGHPYCISLLHETRTLRLFESSKEYVNTFGLPVLKTCSTGPTELAEVATRYSLRRLDSGGVRDADDFGHRASSDE